MHSNPFLILLRPWLAVLLAIGPLAVVHAAPATAEAQTAPVQPEAATATEADAQLRIMAGEMAAGRQEPGVAAREFLAALAVIKDAELAQRTTALAAAARDEDLTLRAAQRWLEIEPTAGDAREVIARVALRQGRADEVAAQCRELIKGHASGVDDGFRQAALILGQTDNRNETLALTIMQQLVSEWPQRAAAHHALSALALRYGELPLAEKAGLQAVKLAPGDRDHVLPLVGVYIRQDRLADADALIEQVLRKDKKPADVRMAYAKLLLEADRRDAARAQLQKILAQQPKHADAAFALGILAYNDRDYAKARGYFEPLLTGQRAQEAAFELGRIAEAQDDYAKAQDYYSRITRGPQALDAAVRRAGLLARQDQLDGAQALMQNLRQQLPQLAQRFYLAEGQMLVDTDHLDAAVELYTEALDDFPGDNDLTYGRSLVYERQNRIDLAEQDLRNLIAADKEDSRALNALGYMLTVHTKRLDEAHDLIGRALALEPDDPAIIDSMGWVQFKRGHVEEALALLRKAHERFPDAEVAAHLGEVLWTLGQRDEARSVWDAALRTSPDHAALKETVQRLAP